MDKSNAAESLINKQIEANIVGEEKARYSMVINSSEEIQKSQSLLNAMKTQGGITPEGLKKIAELEAKLFDIFEERINLTHSIIKRSLMAPISTSQPKVEEVKQEPTRKESAKQETKVVSMTFLKGWTRRNVIGTPDVAFEPKILELIKNATTEAHIDEVATILINDDRHEDALNLQIELFKNTKLNENAFEVEKRFVNTILPNAFGVKGLTPLQKGDKISLGFWVNNLKALKRQQSAKTLLANKMIEDIKSKKIVSKETQELIKTTESGMFSIAEGNKSLLETVAEQLKINLTGIKFEETDDTKELKALIPTIVKDAIEDLKSSKCITIKTQSQIEKFRDYPELESQIFGEIIAKSKLPNIKAQEDIQWEAVNEADIKTLAEGGKKGIIIKPLEEAPKDVNSKDSVPFRLIDLEEQATAKLNAGEQVAAVLQFFMKEYNKVTDKPQDKKPVDIWTSFLNKKKEDIVTKAEEAAAQGKDTVIEDSLQEKNKVKEVIKDFFRKGKIDKKFNAANESTKYMKDAEVRKLFKGESTDKLIKTWKNEVDKEVISEVKTTDKGTEIKVQEPISTVMPKIDIEKVHPEVWEVAKTCKNLGEFVKLIKDIITKKMSISNMNPEAVAANLSQQYLINFPDCAKWTEEKKDMWFDSVLKSITKASEEKPVVDAEHPMGPEEKLNESSTETSTSGTTEDVFLKYSELVKRESNSNRAKVHIADFLLTDTSPIEERKNKASELLKSNNIWKKAPQKDRDNTVNKIIKDNPKVAELIKVAELVLTV